MKKQKKSFVKTGVKALCWIIGTIDLAGSALFGTLGMCVHNVGAMSVGFGIAILSAITLMAVEKVSSDMKKEDEEQRRVY